MHVQAYHAFPSGGQERNQEERVDQGFHYGGLARFGPGASGREPAACEHIPRYVARNRPGMTQGGRQGPFVVIRHLTASV
jgi:hypothetical protein